MKIYNFKTDVNVNKDNYMSSCPIPGYTAKRKRISGKYIYERFYKIDFFDIKKDSYVISSFGRVFSLINNIEMKPRKRKKSGYLTINMQTNTGSRVFSVHCLVARAFVLKTPDDKRLGRMFVHHKNWDNDYNYYWNLEWRSRNEIPIIAKVQNNKDIERDDLIKSICKLLELETPVLDIFDIIGKQIPKDTILKIKNRQIETNISKKYNF